MKKYLFFFVMVCMGIHSVFGQSFSLISNNESSGLNDYTVRQFDVFSFSSNPSTLMNEKGVSCGLFSERKYMLSELSVGKIFFSAATSKGNIGVAAKYGGSFDYTESSLSFYYAKRISKNLTAGLGFNYLNNKSQSEKIHQSFGSSIGINFILSAQLQAGISFQNPERICTSNKSSSPLDYRYEFGIGYDATNDFYMHIHTSKKEDSPLEITGGLQYRPSKKFFCNAGLLSVSKSMYLGAGLIFKKTMVGISIKNHPQLGASPVLSVSSNIKKPNTGVE